MDKAKRRFLCAALGVAACFALWELRAAPPAVGPAAPPYATRCSVVDANTVEGFVTNLGPALLQVNGTVSFSFTVANSMSRPTVQAPGAALIPSGQTASVARAQLVWSLMPSEVCQLDVSGAVR
ncbi:MAG: hypothetical protein PHS14_02680 [Elusimicrobia bacterium]|nr:hypothetical protein [Elusimicrobiota bacterium]